MAPSRIFVAAALVIGLTFISPAQGQQNDPPTDRELFSAYCVGVLNHKLSQRNLLNRPAHQASFDRFRAYIMARGVENRVLASRGVNIAAQRGWNDESACRTTYDSCLDHCLADPGCDVDKNLPICASAACDQPDRCSDDAIKLPF